MRLDVAPDEGGAGFSDPAFIQDAQDTRTQVAVFTIKWPVSRQLQAMPAGTGKMRLKVFGGPDMAAIDDTTISRPADATSSTIILPTDPTKILPVG